MATNALNLRDDDAHLHLRRSPPRFPASRGSMSAVAQSASTETVGLAAAWVALWEACGGGLASAPDGRRVSFIPEPADRAAAVLRPLGFCPANEAEWRGATMCLAAMLSIAGPEAAEAVFTLGAEG
jgi:hypothetical protein